MREETLAHRGPPWRAALVLSLGLHAIVAILAAGGRGPEAGPAPLSLVWVELAPAPDGPRASEEPAGPPAPARDPEPVVHEAPRPVAPRPQPRRAPAPPPRVATDGAVEDGAPSPAAPPPPAGAGAGTGGAPGVPGGTGDAPIPARAAAVPPALVERVLPVYPPAARRREMEGLVLLELIVDRVGRVEDASVRVVRSRPPFDDAAMEAVRRWRFRPGRDARGAAVRVLLEVPIRFTLR